jgi:LacI family transcriptional regulator, galactose operon repressor
MITITDTAIRAGVAPSTVSRVLSGNGYSGRNTRDLELQVADDLAYTLNRVAQSLWLKQTKTLGLVIADVENSFYSRIAKTVKMVAKRAGFYVVLFNSNDGPQEERDCLELLLELRVNGVLITPTDKNAADFRSLVSRNVKIVQLDRKVPKLRCDSVVVNNRKGAEAAVEHLILHGHRRIGLLAGEIHVTTGRQRPKGYRVALAKHQIPFDPSLVRESNFLGKTAIDAARSLFNMAKLPTAVFAANNVLAESCLFVLKELRLSRSVSVVVFDDAPLMRLIDRSLTVVAQLIEELAKTAAKLIVQRVQGRTSESAFNCSGATLITRDSSENINRTVEERL